MSFRPDDVARCTRFAAWGVMGLSDFASDYVLTTLPVYRMTARPAHVLQAMDTKAKTMSASISLDFIFLKEPSMQKQTVFAALATLACTAALAQAPASVNARPPAEVNPTASGGAAASNAQNKVDMRTSQSNKAPANPVAGDGRGAPVAEINPTAAGGKAAAKAQARVDTRLMDSNADGMVSRQEWDSYHADAWKNMKPTNTGVSTADIDKLNRTPMTN